MPTRFVALLAAAPLLATMLAVVPVGSVQAADDVVKMRLLRATKQLPVAREVRRGYDRDKFAHWIDANGNCRDTRDEVLKAESTRRTRGGCDITRGRWVSYYDREVVRRATNLDIDHMVPLAESWDSGARRWNADTRMRFANDLRDRRSLVAVTASTNRSKSDRDPAEWMPQFGKCRYAKEWVAVKTRWSLSVDRAEKRALVRRVKHCSNPVIKVRKAKVRLRS